ncbi:MAG TPA: hypothetical protein VH561_09565 [Micromonosporaceae bacterium]|jgi:hypothetical protein
MPTTPIAIALETTPKKTFAVALDWPGWCRAGRDPDAALTAVADYAQRYAPVAAAAGFPLPATITLEERERMPGGASTAFGVPERTFEADRARVSRGEAKRLADLLRAAWTYFDEVATRSPEQLRKGPRGGGRDRDKMIDHVLGAESAYARQLGLKIPPPAIGDTPAITALREALLAVLGVASDGSPVHKWTTRYAARRIAWHALDHAWEMQDRTE